MSSHVLQAVLIGQSVVSPDLCNYNMIVNEMRLQDRETVGSGSGILPGYFSVSTDICRFGSGPEGRATKHIPADNTKTVVVLSSQTYPVKRSSKARFARNLLIGDSTSHISWKAVDASVIHHGFSLPKLLNLQTPSRASWRVLNRRLWLAGLKTQEPDAGHYKDCQG